MLQRVFSDTTPDSPTTTPAFLIRVLARGGDFEDRLEEPLDLLLLELLELDFWLLLLRDEEDGEDLEDDELLDEPLDFEVLFDLSEDFFDELPDGSVTSHLLTLCFLVLPSDPFDVSSKALEMALEKALEGLERILAPAGLCSLSSSESLEDSYMLRVAAGGHHKRI